MVFFSHCNLLQILDNNDKMKLLKNPLGQLWHMYLGQFKKIQYKNSPYLTIWLSQLIRRKSFI